MIRHPCESLFRSRRTRHYEILEERLPLAADFGFLFDAPVDISGPPGSSVSIPITVQIDSTLSVPSEGAQGWSMSIQNQTPSDVSIVSATPLISPSDFEVTQITTGAGNEGVVHATILDFGNSVVLPAGMSDVLSLTLEGIVPAAGVTETWRLEFVDGLQGSGQPVTNWVTSLGESVTPTYASLSISVTGEVPPPPFEFLMDGPTATTAVPGSLVSVPITVQIDSTLSAPSEGAQGWSMSIQNQTPSDASIVSATPLISPSDFEVTQITTGAGNEGVVHATILDFGNSVVLPAGMSDVLSLTLEGIVPAAGVTETWRLEFVDGLQGSGQPVTNWVTSLGESVTPTLSSFSISVTGGTPEVLFEFLMDGPTATTAVPGTLVSVPITVQIDSTLSAPSEGAQGWGMSVKNQSPSDASIVSATPLIVPSAVEATTEITTGAGNEGVVHAAILDYDATVVLPAGVSDVLSLTLEGIAPAAGVTEIWTLQFVDGLQDESGLPFGNWVNSLGSVVWPTLSGFSISVTGEAAPLTISIDDLTVLEGDAGVTNAFFTVTLSEPADQPVVLDYVAINGTATAGLDFENAFGSLTFQPGQKSRFVVVPIIGDALKEADETFMVHIANTSQGVIVDADGHGTILNDDALATVDSVAINDGSAQRSKVDRITVTFGAEVMLLAGAFKVSSESGELFAADISSSVVGGQTVAVLTFSGPSIIGGSLPDGSYTLTIDSTKVLDSLGKALDGDGDGTNGGNRVDAFFRLFGDNDGDGDVDKADRDLFRRAFDTPLGHPFYLDFFDFDGDGDIDQRDRREFNNRFNMK